MLNPNLYEIPNTLPPISLTEEVFTSTVTLNVTTNIRNEEIIETPNTLIPEYLGGFFVKELNLELFKNTKLMEGPIIFIPDLKRKSTNGIYNKEPLEIHSICLPQNYNFNREIYKIENEDHFDEYLKSRKNLESYIFSNHPSSNINNYFSQESVLNFWQNNNFFYKSGAVKLFDNDGKIIYLIHPKIKTVRKFIQMRTQNPEDQELIISYDENQFS